MADPREIIQMLNGVNYIFEGIRRREGTATVLNDCNSTVTFSTYDEHDRWQAKSYMNA